MSKIKSTKQFKEQVDAAFATMAEMSGPGSATARTDAARALFGAATEREQHLLRGLVSGELRQGALDALLLDAVAEAAGVPADVVRRAAMLAGETEAVAVAALSLLIPAVMPITMTISTIASTMKTPGFLTNIFVSSCEVPTI